MPTTPIDPSSTLRQLLLTMPENSSVMQSLGVSATRDGDRTLAELCELQGLEVRTLARVLAATRDTRQQALTFSVELMTLTQLCDHLEDWRSPKMNGSITDSWPIELDARRSGTQRFGGWKASA